MTYQKALEIVDAFRAMPPVLKDSYDEAYDAPNARAITAAERVLAVGFTAGCAPPNYVSDSVDGGVYLSWWAPGKHATVRLYNVPDEEEPTDGDVSTSIHCYMGGNYSDLKFDYTDEGYGAAVAYLMTFLDIEIPDTILQPYLARLATGMSIMHARGEYLAPHATPSGWRRLLSWGRRESA